MKASGKPLIGITGPVRGGFSAWIMTAIAVRRAGGRPIRITAETEYEDHSLLGIIIGGGTDVDPFHYGEEPNVPAQEPQTNTLLDWTVGLALSAVRAVFARHDRNAQPFDPDRDILEKRLIRHALYAGKPLLGICRGAQLINVTLGGSLHQNIDHFYEEGTKNPRSILPSKTVTLAHESRLNTLLGGPVSRVNALHEQSIRELGKGLVVSAREDNGVIQGIEQQGSLFVLGVQWHPEYLPQYRNQQRLFHALVGAAAQDP